MSAITKSAKGQPCAVRIPGVCLYGADTVVWAHANGSAAGKGIGMKSHDLLGAYACRACHDAYDGRGGKAPGGWSKDEIALMFAQGHYRSLLILLKAGLVKT